MEDKEFTGGSVEQALEKAAQALGVEKEEIAYEVIEEGRIGIFGFGQRQVRIRLIESQEAEEQAEEGEEQVAVDEELFAPLEEESLSAFAQKALDLMKEVIRLWQMDLEIAVKVDEPDYLLLDLDGIDRKYLLSKDGQVINSLQYLVNIIMFGMTNSRKKIQLNSGDYREKRERELIDRAKRLAEKAKRFKEEKRMNYLNPYERRLVHLALNDDEGVTTFSVGRGFLKKVVIAPVE